MQAISASPKTAAAARDELTRDTYALMSYLMREATLGTLNTIAELEISFTQMKALCALEADGEDRSVKALAESLKVSLPAMSRAVDGLHERGFVEREEDPVDRRMKRVRPTDSGRAISASLTEGRLVGMREFLLSLNDAEAAALSRALALILAGHPEIAELRPARNAGGS